MTRSLELHWPGRRGHGRPLPPNPFGADEVTALDIAPEALAAGALPFPDEQFQYVCAAGDGCAGFWHALAAEAGRILRPGGFLLAISPAGSGGTPDLAGAGLHPRLRRRVQAGYAQVFQKQVDFQPPPASPRPRVSVLMPVYNGASYLPKTLEALREQSYPEFEVLCIDDCSSDDSGAILAACARQDPRFRLFRPERNQGTAPRSLALALPAMTGQYFVYSSQDDLFSRDWLERMVERAVATGADAVLPDVVLFHEQEPERDRVMAGLHGDREVQLSGMQAMLLSLDWSIPGNALWSAELVRRVGFETFAVNSDEYTARTFFARARKVAFSGGQFRYRQDNPGAITRQKNARLFDWPLTRLRVADFLVECAVAPAIIRRERRGAARDMRSLERWYQRSQEGLSAPERARIEARLAEFRARVRQKHLFERLQAPRALRLLRRLGSALGLLRRA